MAIPFERTEPEQTAGILPPWLWFWLILYLLGLPAVFGRIGTNVSILLTNTSTAAISPTYDLLTRVPSVTEILLDLVLILGVLTVFLPWTRTRFLQREYRLTEFQNLSGDTAPETLQVLNSIASFVRQFAPKLVLTYNVAGRRMRDQAFVYPIGYRKAGLALSGSFLTLWQKDRQVAEAILLHELEHYRRGDFFVIGAGSFLETIVRNWLALTLIFTLAPLVIFFVIDGIATFQEATAVPGAQLPTAISFTLQQLFVLEIPSIIILFLGSLFWAAALFTIVIIAIWCAEINADRFVIDTMQSTQPLARAIRQHKASSSPLQWLLSGIYHPPVALRRRLVLRPERVRGLLFLLLLFPLAWVLRLFLLSCWALFQYVVFIYSGTRVDAILQVLGINVLYFVEGLVPTWVAMALLLAGWPLLAGYWERIFGHKASRIANIRYTTYLSATAIVALVCIVGLVLSRLPAPTSPDLSAPSAPYAQSAHASGHFQVGETATIGSQWGITVNGVQVRPDNGITQAQTGYAYLAIDVSLKNISSQTTTLMDDLQFVLRDAQGRAYSETYVARPLPPAVQQDDQVPPGTTARGQLTYEIPASLASFTLSFITDWRNYDPNTTRLTVWDIAPQATTTPAVTATPNVVSTTTVGYPMLQAAYEGTLVNTTDNSNTSATAALSSIKETQQGTISGEIAIQLPLAGSGPFTGTVSRAAAIRFTVTPNDGSGYNSIVFTGTIHSDGSMDGTFTLPGTNQGGTWHFQLPAQ